MSTIPHDATIVRRSVVVANDLSDTETVMLDADRGLYFGVENVGKAIWAALEQPTTLDGLCSDLQGRFDVDPETCRQETVVFLEQLEAAGLIDVGRETSG